MSNDFQQQAEGQDAPWAIHNENFDSIAGVGLYAHDKDADSGLTYGYQGGVFAGVVKVKGTIGPLSNNATVYVVAHRTTGALSHATSLTNWNDTTTYARVAIVTTSGGQVANVQDWRFDSTNGLLATGGSSGGGGGTTGTPLVTIAGAGASHQLDPANAESMHRFTGTGAKSFLVEPDSNLAAEQSYHIANRGSSGNVTIVVDSNIVVNNPKDGSRVLEPGDTVTLYFVSATEADLFGSTQQ
jgi:hypothetical protein